MKRATLLLLIPLIILAGLFKYMTASHEIYSTVSPDDRCHVKFTEERGALLLVSFAYLNVDCGGKPLIEKELIYSGDTLDPKFHEYYPEKVWRTPNVLALVGRGDIPSDLIEIKNTRNSGYKYMLIETYRDKIFVFDLEPNSTVNFNFDYPGWFSVEVVGFNGERIKKTTRDVTDEYKDGKKFTINLDREDINIEVPQK